MRYIHSVNPFRYIHSFQAFEHRGGGLAGGIRRGVEEKEKEVSPGVGTRALPQRLKAEAERKQRKEDAARARAAAAPDADKLRKWAKSLVGAELPEMVTMAGQHAVNVFKSRVAALAKEIVAEADRITK